MEQCFLPCGAPAGGQPRAAGVKGSYEGWEGGASVGRAWSAWRVCAGLGSEREPTVDRGGRAPTRDASGAITRDPGGPARNPPGQDRSSPSKIVVAGPSNTESALNVIRCLAGVGEEDTLYGF